MSIHDNNNKVKQEEFSVIQRAMPVVISEIDGEKLQSVNARYIHAFMGIGKDYTTWIKSQLDKYGFVESVDFAIPNFGERDSNGYRVQHDYLLTIDTAKEIAMVQNNENGRLVRQYFIAVEKEFRNPTPKLMTEEEMVLGYLAKIKENERLLSLNDQLQVEVNTKKLALDYQQPFVEHSQAIRDTSTLITPTQLGATEGIGISARAINQFLKTQGVIRSVGGAWCLTAPFLNKGYAKLTTHTYTDKFGKKETAEFLKWTQEGRAFALKLWKDCQNNSNAEAI